MLSGLSGLSGLSAVCGGAAAWTPTAITGLTYVTVGPDTCFADAGGTTPAGVGDGVYTLNSKYGPAVTFRQAASGSRPILRQDGGGKYYLELASGRYMNSVGTVDLTANEPATIALALNPVGRNGYLTYFCIFGAVGSAGHLRSYWRGAAIDTEYYQTYGPMASFTASTNIARNRSCIATTPDGVTVAIYEGGVSQSVTNSGTSHAAESGCYARLGNFDGAGQYSGSWNCYGFGWRLGTAALTPTEVAALDTYQQGLYTP